MHRVQPEYKPMTGLRKPRDSMEKKSSEWKMAHAKLHPSNAVTVACADPLLACCPTSRA